MASELVVNVGGMFSGKTTELLRQGKRHTLAKEKVIYIKPDIDNRYSNTRIVNHNGDYEEGLILAVDEPLYRDATLEADVILVDEVQFFHEAILIDILMLLDRGKKIYCSGLDLSFDHKPFKVTAELMAYADVVQKFKAVCLECGADAFITAKRGVQGASTDKIDVGSADKYVPLCRECYHSKNIGGMV